MLTAIIEQNGKTYKENIFVIDSHSHLGQDVDGASMMNPLAPGTGTFDFWANIQGQISTELEERDQESMHVKINGIFSKLTWNFNPFPFTDQLYRSLERIGRNFSNLKEKSKFYTLVDQAVVFPFQDVFRDKRPEARYRASNINISRFTTRFPFSMKLIGYARVDPMEGEKAIKEVRYAREVLGLRGLKLHPRSEGYIDSINSEKVINVLIEAARHSMPIIFDTRGRKTILDIGALVSFTRNLMAQNHPELLPHFKVIIAHFAQGNIGDYDVYRAIVQPGVYGDLSMLHGEGAANFFKDFRKWFIDNDKIQVDGRDWSEYLLFATDYPYFGAAHAEKLLIQILNSKFFESGGTLHDIKNILGLNQLKVLPEYCISQYQQKREKLPSIMISNQNIENKSSYDLAVDSIAKLLSVNQINIKRIAIQFKENWDSITENILLYMTKYGKDKEYLIQLLNLVPEKLTLIAPISSELEWKKFGYKHFNPNDRKYFNEIFQNNFLVTNEEQIINVLSQLP
ncbi:MAG: amidohydrolase family protein [Promethearchaeota archaeon]